MQTKIGADPELFIQDGYEYISAHGILPGTKQEPFKVDKGAVQVDGMAFEFNIDPAINADEFDNNIKTVITQMEEMVKKVSKSFKLSFVPFAKFSEEYFLAQPEKAKILGCDPDFSTVGAQQTPPPGLEKQPFRTAAGHVHIGWTEDMRPFHPDHFLECQRIASVFRNDEFFKPKTMLEKRRFQFYGSNGAFRPKSYGIELRAPSNRWVQTEENRRKMFNAVMNKFTLIKR